jgi:hypothetical protein
MREAWVQGSMIAAVMALLGGSARAHAQTCSDPTRTIQATGAAACRVYDGDPASCARAWAITQSGAQAVSCFYVPAQNACQGCGPSNQTSGLCVNTCAAPPATPVDALSPLASGGLAVALAIGSLWSARRRQRSCA